MRLSWCAITVGLSIWGSTSDVRAAALPEHDALTIAVIADEVNPNNLSDAELTQPGDIAGALMNAGSGINIAAVVDVDSSCVDDGVTALEDGTADVLIYFAHRAASDCGGGDGQARLDAAVESFLMGGGGVVVFHHGIYTAPGKESILALLGGTASQLFWDTTDGQTVINVAPEHFVTSNEVDYGEMRSFGDPGFGIEMADYPAFNNTPDERYPGLQFITEGDETRTILFASDYQGAQILGYDLHRPAWGGHVVLYQPGEFQPNALDNVDGDNFQILANAIYYVATTQETPSGTTGDPTGEETGSEPDTGDAETTDPSDPSMPGSTSSGTGEPGTATDTDTSPEATGTDEGCGCRSTPAPAGLLFLLAAGFIRRRR